MERIEAEHPRPRHFLLHLSDPHLLGGPQPLHGVVDSEALLRQLFEDLVAPDFDRVVGVPRAGGAVSFNRAAAAAVLLYEATRTRQEATVGR